ncbi:P-loop containing nucleoside triphosphate hydrolase protein [Leucosporidium creatinivorum]|uniref:DNA 3'-5' helicase n=1 Tax=Leucosporidium creatinivorum TaxID=106004 RepID=A0A1Y2EPX1_9BASI|nr:P-loop containing nucleoside triphosphate hydrolase protein [Leucosporidium creatinivorum]
MDFDSTLLAEAEGLDTREPTPTRPPSPPPELTALQPALKQSTLTFGTLQPAAYLPSLNKAQRTAVTAPSTGSLQILAGPGSAGKTKVLTTRVAYLLQQYKIEPEELVVVTFTNKAANEMKLRLSVIVGAATVEKLMMGTFHSVCVRYLRKYGKLINLPNNFIIADRDDCLAIIKRILPSILSSHSDDLKKELKPNLLLDVISKCKSSEMSPSDYRAQQAKVENEGARERMEAIWRVYEDYEAELAKDNALDFDDLLLRGLNLLQRFPRVVSKVKNVLIDEFQDTNGTQYSLVKLIAKASGSLTIVGDPDQSIYGWRNADVENLEKMVNDFAPVQQIYLEENYRSTGAILGAALAVVRQDTTRIPKSLTATHPTGSSVVLHCAPTAFDEASFIAAQIKHLVAHSGGLVDYGDVAVLLRYGALSRVVEVALQKSGIPSRMVGGHKFFERAEVKDLLSYLQLIDNPSYTSAFTRIINVPKRGLGEKSVKEILGVAKKKGWTAWDVAVKLAKGSGVVGLTSAQRKGVREFVKTVSEARGWAEEGKSVSDLIDLVCENVAYRAHLEKTQGPDAQERWMNVEELKSTNALRTFLAVSMLATDTETQDAKADKLERKVTLSTVHAAKGLEWAVVFVPGCENGVFPFYRSESPNEINEERRLLYVAITRAQGFCTLSHSMSRMTGATVSKKELTPFLSTVSKTYPTLFVKRLQKIGPTTRVEMARVLGRPAPSEELALQLIQAQ